MRSPSFLSLVPLAVALAACASTEITDRDAYEGGKLPRPGRILVYDFAATPSDLPVWSDATSGYAAPGTPPTADELEAGRKLGRDVGRELVAKLSEMGMTAVEVPTGSAPTPAPQLDDLAIVGYFTSVDTGSAAERIVVGFGKGAADVQTYVAGYHMTASGMQQLGSGSVDSEGGKSPGLGASVLLTVATKNPIGLAVSGAAHAAGEISGRSGAEGAADRVADEIAKALRAQFEKQGWI